MSLSRRTLTIFTEGDRTRGLGHLTRCQAYAEGWRMRGGEIAWVVDGDDAARSMLGDPSAAFTAWQFAPPTAPGGQVLIDSYSAPRATYAALAPSGGVFIDDLVRLNYPAGVVVHSAPGEVAPRGEADWLTGPSWHPLRPEFWEVAERPTRDAIQRVLVVLGGVDHRGLGERLAKVLLQRLPDAEVDLILGAAVADPSPLPRLKAHRGLSAAEMRDRMLDADIAVTAAGQTLYELACCGCPALLVGVADNQSKHMKVWPTTDAGRSLGWWDDADLDARLDRALTELDSGAEARAVMSASGRRLVDGQGVNRLWDRVLSREA